MAYRDGLERLLASGENAEMKRFMVEWVSKIELAPEAFEAEIRFKIPEPVVDGMGDGANSHTPTLPNSHTKQ